MRIGHECLTRPQFPDPGPLYTLSMPTRLEKLKKLHAADPRDADVTYMIAMELTKADDQAAALPGVIDWLDKTLALDANYLYAYFQKAKAQSALGDADAAIATLKLGIDNAKQAGDAKAVSELGELLASME